MVYICTCFHYEKHGRLCISVLRNQLKHLKAHRNGKRCGGGEKNVKFRRRGRYKFVKIVVILQATSSKRQQQQRASTKRRKINKSRYDQCRENAYFYSYCCLFFAEISTYDTKRFVY